MEPLASITPALLRPAVGPGGDLGGHLQAGTVLVGEVAQRLDGGTLLINLGGQQVPAETGVELEPGDRFLVQVERHGGELALRILPEARGGADPAVLEAMRHLLAKERPLGAVLGELVAELRGALAANPNPTLAALLVAIEGRRLDPEGGSAALRALLAADQQAWPAALAAALAESGVDGFEAALRALGAELRAALLNLGAEGQELAALERALAAALRGAAGAGGDGRDLSALLERLAAGLGRELEAAGAGRAAELTRAAGAGLFRGHEAAVLRALAQAPGALGGRAESARGLVDGALTSLGADLRGRLAAALVALDDGALRQAIGRALSGLDLEQMMNALRRDAGEAFHVSVPLPDGEGWATAELLVLDRDPHSGGLGYEQADGEEEHGSFRIVMGVEFTRLGAVRADLLVRHDSVAARVRASRPATAALLRVHRAELVALLGQEGRRVTLALLDATEAEVSIDELAHDMRYLREHHLMDVRG